MRKNVRNLRGMFTEDSRSLLFACGRYKLAWSVPHMQHLSLAAELQMLRQELEALLQGRLLQVWDCGGKWNEDCQAKWMKASFKSCHKCYHQSCFSFRFNIFFFFTLQNLRNKMQSMLRKNWSRWTCNAGSRQLRLSCQLLRLHSMQSAAAERRTICISSGTVDLPNGSWERILLVAVLWRWIFGWRTSWENAWWSTRAKTTENHSYFVTTSTI